MGPTCLGICRKWQKLTKNKQKLTKTEKTGIKLNFTDRNLKKTKAVWSQVLITSDCLDELASAAFSRSIIAQVVSKYSLNRLCFNVGERLMQVWNENDFFVAWSS